MVKVGLLPLFGFLIKPKNYLATGFGVSNIEILRGILNHQHKFMSPRYCAQNKILESNLAKFAMRHLSTSIKSHSWSTGSYMNILKNEGTSAIYLNVEKTSSLCCSTFAIKQKTHLAIFKMLQSIRIYST